jgi:glyoxylase-like metal-dependent hydrolase (beta-lactamase superfamily II)
LRVIHHLNCASFRPTAAPRMVAHCLLVERDQGLLLVDTGFGSDDLADPRRLGQPFRAITRPVLDPHEPAAQRVRELGHEPDDVTDIVLTHLDLDHAGGIGDFPQARVHVQATELHAAQHPGRKDRGRYVPGQWANGPEWMPHPAGGDDWFGFRSATALGDDVVLVPLHGHSRGHQGVAVARPDGGWLFHAGDSYFSTGDKQRPRECPRTLRILHTALAHDNKARLANLERIQELHAAHADEVTVFCAHDASELAALQTS